jgi:hypothetical protein
VRLLFWSGRSSAFNLQTINISCVLSEISE